MYSVDIDNSFEIESNVLELLNTKTNKEMIKSLVYYDLKNKNNTTRKSISNKYGLTEDESRTIYEKLSLVKS